MSDDQVASAKYQVPDEAVQAAMDRYEQTNHEPGSDLEDWRKALSDRSRKANLWKRVSRCPDCRQRLVGRGRTDQAAATVITWAIDRHKCPKRRPTPNQGANHG